LAALGWVLIRQQALHWQVVGVVSFAVALTWLGAVAWWRRHPQPLRPRAPEPVAERAAERVVAPAPVGAERTAEAPAAATQAAVRVVFASQTGFAEQLARQTAQALRDTGLAACLDGLDTLDVAALQATRRALFVVSTTGDGDPPDAAAAFFQRCMAQPADLSALHYGLLALGDQDYDDFCGFGHKLERWLRASGAQALFDLVEVDSEDESALRHWQQRLALVTGDHALPDWQTPRYQRWQLVARQVLNPGSVGAPCFQVALRPLQGKPSWEAGDLVEIGPCQVPSAVNAWLAAQQLDGAALVTVARERLPLAALLARSRLPPAAEVAGLDADAVAALVQRLPHREYSIASLPADGALHLLVRRMCGPDAVPGVGSGWLTEYAEVGAEVALRVRSNVNFHMPAGACPLILIGNGTGMAALHALLEARIAARRSRNWLLFGERQVAHDFYYREQIAQWLANGQLERADFAWSRDQPERVYVQQRLREAADELRRWVAAGTVILVCGSLAGMAPAVDAVLREVLGATQVEQLRSAGRYRRDVY
jgi:sulfite reductase (NADPH) flavoprotein alpha-component